MLSWVNENQIKKIFLVIQLCNKQFLPLFFQISGSNINGEYPEIARMRCFWNVYNLLLFGWIGRDFSQYCAHKQNKGRSRWLSLATANAICEFKFAFVWIKIASFYYLLLIFIVVISLERWHMFVLIKCHFNYFLKTKVGLPWWRSG